MNEGRPGGGIDSSNSEWLSRGVYSLTDASDRNCSGLTLGWECPPTHPLAVEQEHIALTSRVTTTAGGPTTGDSVVLTS